MKNLSFYGDAYQGKTYGDATEYYQYATKDGKTYKVTWLYDKTYLDTIESMDEIPFNLKDIDRVEKESIDSINR